MSRLFLPVAGYWLGAVAEHVSAARIMYTLWTFFIVGFALFQKRLLPPRLATLAARAYFYPTLPLTYARLCFLPPHAGLWTRIDETVLIGAAPIGILGHPRRLRRLGVRAVINCCDEYNGPDWSRHHIEHLHIPTVDHLEPSLADLKTAVRFIESHRRQGHRVYVHCKAGHGRSAAVAYAWLLHANYGKVAPFELFEGIAARRRVRQNLWRQVNILSFYESLPLGNGKQTPQDTSSTRIALQQRSAVAVASSDPAARSSVTAGE